MKASLDRSIVSGITLVGLSALAGCGDGSVRLPPPVPRVAISHVGGYDAQCANSIQVETAEHPLLSEQEFMDTSSIWRTEQATLVVEVAGHILVGQADNPTGDSADLSAHVICHNVPRDTTAAPAVSPRGPRGAPLPVAESPNQVSGDITFPLNVGERASTETVRVSFSVRGSSEEPAITRAFEHPARSTPQRADLNYTRRSVTLNGRSAVSTLRSYRIDENHREVRARTESTDPRNPITFTNQNRQTRLL